MIEKTIISYNEVLGETASRLKAKMESGKITQDDYGKAMKHIREEQETLALAQDS